MWRNSSALGCGQITENELRSSVCRCVLPNLKDAFHRCVALGAVVITGFRGDKAIVEARLAGVIGDFQRVVDARVFGQMFHALDDFFHVGSLTIRPLHHMIEGLTAVHGRGKRAHTCLCRLLVQIVLRHYICKGAVHGKQLRHVLEAGKTRLQLVIHPRGVQLPTVGYLAEGGSPGVKILNVLGFQLVKLQIALQRIDFGNGIADGRSGHEVHATAFMLLLQIAALDEHIQSLG